jgi:two-component system, cell cycle response regulator
VGLVTGGQVPRQQFGDAVDGMLGDASEHGAKIVLRVASRLGYARTRRRHVHLILLTSKNSKEDIISGLSSGADDYLVKPFDPGELKARLRSGIRILELEDKLLEAREELRFKATHDGLTTLLNRGAIIEVLARELTRALCERSCITVLLGDIDHFKSVNDTHGHPVGDEVLEEVGRRLLASVRSYDFVGRYGGEEFLVVLNRCGADRALLRAEQIRLVIGQTPIPTTKGALPVTWSLGACTVAGNEPRTVESVLSDVDHAHYEAKSAGRNCCRMAAVPVGIPAPSLQ